MFDVRSFANQLGRGPDGTHRRIRHISWIKLTELMDGGSRVSALCRRDVARVARQARRSATSSLNPADGSQAHEPVILVQALRKIT